MSGDAINLLHKDMKMQNVFVVQANNLQRVKLAVGDFGAAQLGVEIVSHMFENEYCFVDIREVEHRSFPRISQT